MAPFFTGIAKNLGGFGFGRLSVGDDSYEYWIATLGGSGNDVGQDIAIDSSGNLFVAGYTVSDGAGGDDAFITKIDALGNLQWQRTLGGASNDRFNGVAIDSSDNVYVCGNTQSEGQGSSDTLVVKYNNSGTLQWQKRDGTTGSDALYSIDINSSGTLIWGCGTRYSASNLPHIAIYVYNSSGTIQDQRGFAYGTAATGYGVATSGNDAYIVGYWDTGAPANDVWLAKINQVYNIVWQRSLQSSLGDFPALHGVTVDSSGNVYLAVNYTNGFYPDTAVVKYNSSGTLQWQRSLTQYAEIPPNAITTDSDDYVYVVCQGNGVGAGNYDWYIAKYNSSGTLQWERALGATGTDIPTGIKVVDGNMYITGYTSSTGEGGNDIMIAKLPADGSLTGTYGSFTYQAASGVTEAAGTLTAGTPTLTNDNPKDTPVNATSTLTDSVSTLTESLTTI